MREEALQSSRCGANPGASDPIEPMAVDPPDITVVGSYNTDLIFSSPRLPLPGETVLGRGLRTAHGGKGANQAIAAARLGARVALLGTLGHDAFGESALALLRAEGIETGWVEHSTTDPTGAAAILLDATGQNAIVVAPGANAALTPARVQEAAALLRSSQVVVAQLECPLDAVHAALEIAREGGATTLLNPAPAQPLPAEMLAMASLLTPNESEAAALSGLPVSDATGAERAARALQARGAHIVVVTLGAEGALLVPPGTRALHVPAPLTCAVETTGAGDAFSGALAAGLAEGLVLERAVRRAVLAASLSVRRPGAAESMPTRAEVERAEADAEEA